MPQEQVSNGLTAEELKKNDDTVRYAKGIIIPDDDDCHLSDHSHFWSSNVADPGEAVAGLQVMKKK